MTNAKYNDSGKYSVQFILKPLNEGVGVDTVNVHGIFFSYCQ